MNTLPTAEEFLKNFHREEEDELDKAVEKAMIEFAKLHCEAQKQAILENAEIKAIWETKGGTPEVLGSYRKVFQGYKIDEDSIIKAYPLTNIK